MTTTMLLYRPVGYAELMLIETSDYTEFPPRLREQPRFFRAQRGLFTA